MKLLLTVAVVFALAPNVHADDLSGTVVETMNSGGYTYLRLKTPAGDKWAAVMKANVKKGDKATVVNTMEMKNFESPTLKRKFDTIAFGMLGDGKAPAADPHAGGMKGSMKGGAMGGAAPHGGRAEVKGPIKVTKAAGPDGRTIAEIYAQKKSLVGKEVVVTGKIGKYNPGILERNWAHLHDGTGAEKDGSDDLTVILKDDAQLSQIVTVRGKVVLDKDLGGMYKFPVALEDAVLVK